MNREAAIEAAARALDPQAWDDALWAALDPTGQAQAERQQLTRQEAAAVVDAALPYLVGEPIELLIVNHCGTPAPGGGFVDEAAARRYRLRALDPEDAP